MISIRILFFATYRDNAGIRDAPIEIPEGTSIGELRDILQEKFPGLKGKLEAGLLSINKEYAFDEEIILDGVEIAVFPPVSGGAPTVNFFQITEESIDLNQLIEKITFPETGAACFFTGMVRGITDCDGRTETEFLEYEAYNQMAEEKMEQVAIEIRQKWPAVQGIVLIQRIGTLYPGTPTIAIACSAAHRDTGVFEAARYGIDRLKEIVPIWKKEVSKTEEAWVEGKYIPEKGD